MIQLSIVNANRRHSQIGREVAACARAALHWYRSESGRSKGYETVTTDQTKRTEAGSLRVLLAEGDADTRQSLVSQIEDLANIDLIGAEANAADAIIAAYRLRPDVVLLDLTPPDRSAPDTIRHLLRVCPGVSVAMLVDKEEDARLTPALDAGARESLPKTAPADRLEALLRRLGPNTFPGPSA
jgi:CheY-like chemotaxis protein